MTLWYELFPKIFNMSVTASIIILAVLAVRLLLRKAPKLFSYLLWGVVLFRLLCPVSLPSELSILNMSLPITADIPDTKLSASNTADVADTQPSIPNAADVSGTTWSELEYIPTGINEIVNAALPQDNEQLAANPVKAPVSVFTWIWLSGMAVLLLYNIASYIKLKLKVRCSMPLRDNIYLADHISSPFTAGLLRPRIYLPSDLNGQEQEYIILHEQHHIHRLDYIVKLLAFTALCIHWFNPLVWAAFILAGKDMEMSCDEAVMKKMDHDIRAEYSISLLQLATGRKIIAASPLAFGEGDPKSRIQNVMNYKKPAFWVVAMATAACIIAAVCLLTDPKQETENKISTDSPIESPSSATPDEEIQWAQRPTITLDNITYWDDNMPVETLPYGYEYAGSLRADQVSYPYMEGKDYYTVPGDHNMIYVYQECGTPIDDNTVDNTKRQQAYIQWINRDIYSSGSQASPASTLEAAVQSAILRHNKSASTAKADFAGSFFGDMEVQSSNAVKKEPAPVITQYGWVLYQEYNFSDKGIKTTASRYTPAILTFEQDETGYTLKEYWEPRDGEFFEQDIIEKFPAHLVKNALDGQKYFLSLQQSCYDQAIRYNNLDTDKIIEGLFEAVCSDPKFSSSPKDYIIAHEEEYRELLYYEDYTLRYCFQHFEEGIKSGKKETGLKEQIMSQLCTEVLAGHGYSQLGTAEWLQGYEWYEALGTHNDNILDEIYRWLYVFRGSGKFK